MGRTVWAFAVVALACPLSVRAQQAGGGSAGASDGIVVTAQRPPSQVQLDRKVYTVGHDLQSSSGTAADVLNDIPSVAVDPDGVVTVRGDSNVTILVDGKPSAEFSGAAAGLSLLQFPAGEIERVEVLTNPPARYKASGSGGVINIVTKKSKKPGFSGSAQASVGDHGRYVLGLDGAYNRGRLKLSAGAGLRRDIRERLTTTSRLITDPATAPPVQSNEQIDEHFRRLTPSVKAGLDYELNDRQSLGASVSRRWLVGHRWFDQEDQSGPPDQPPNSLSDRHSDGHEWNLQGSEGVHLEQKLWRPGETLTLSLQQSGTTEHERYAYANTYPLPAAAPTYDDLHLGMDLNTTDVSADYELPLPKGQDLKLGYDLELDSNAFDNLGHNIDPLTGQAVVDPAVSNDFRYRQTVNAGYGEYQTSLAGFELQAGLRLEAAHASWLQITGDQPGGRDDLGLYPSLHLDRRLDEATKLTFGVSRRITRPDPEALNPFTDYQDTHNLRAGNPDLKPQITWLYELGYVFTGRPVGLSATAYYRQDRDSVTDVLQPVGPDVVLATKVNLPKSQAAGLEFSADGKLGRRLTYSLSGDAFWAQIDATALGAPGLKATTGVNLKASLDYHPTLKDTFQVSLNRQDRRLTPQGYVSAINLVNLGYRRQVRSDLALVATVSDLFDGQKFQRLVTSPGLQEDYVRHQLGRVALVGFIYSFGGPSKAKGSGFDYGD